jgi:cytochrome P450
MFPPGPNGLGSVLANLSGIRNDPLGFFGGLIERHGDVSCARMPIGPLYLLNHPDLARRVLQERPQLYRKGIDFERMKPLLGEGLVTSEDATWKRQRRLIQPSFHKARLQSLGALMVEEAQRVDTQLEAQTGAVDLHAAMMKLTLVIVGRALFGTNLGADAETIGRSLDTVLTSFARRNRSLMALLPLWLPLPTHVRFRRARTELERIVYALIAARRHESGPRDDLLAAMMQAVDEEDGSGMTDRELRDETMTLLLAGHETTANALTWTFMLLAKHPETEQRLREEIATVLRGAPPTTDDLPRLPWLNQVVQEAMRLYPPAWAVTRKAVGEDVVRSYPVRPGTLVILCPYFVHRHPDFWSDAERFDPERFAPDQVAARPKFAYFPFGGGPRQCIGNHFAMMEAILILATLLQHRRYALAPGQQIEPNASITLRPQRGLWMIPQAMA